MPSRPHLLSEWFGPRRPCLVVNPVGGTAAPWASWPQPSSENNFPCATRIPRGTNSFGFQALHCVAPARGAASRTEEHTSELQSLMRRSSADFFLEKKRKIQYKT